MLGNLTALAIASLFSVGSYAYSVAIPKPPHLISPLPIHKSQITPKPTATPSPTPLPTATPTPLPTATPTPLPTSEPTDTPTPLPTVTPTPIVTTTDLDTLFQRYADAFSVDKELLKKIANCESGFNSNAENDDYEGMFQFASSSWITTRQAMGEDTNPDLRKNAEEAIKTTAFKISHGGVNAWPSCSK